VFLLAGFIVSACGIKGNLYIEEPAQANNTTSQNN